MLASHKTDKSISVHKGNALEIVNLLFEYKSIGNVFTNLIYILFNVYILNLSEIFHHSTQPSCPSFSTSIYVTL